VKRLLQRIVSPEWRFRAHRFARLRWLTKYRSMRDCNSGVALDRKLAYVLLDPELESFSFELENEAEVIAGLAAALGRAEDELAAYAAETRSDPELNELLSRHLRWRLGVKRRLPLGNRLAWYLLVRALKPQVVVETGIYLGLGSLVLLRALERNREEGSPGELLSFDQLRGAGEIVRPEVRHGWRRFVGSTHDILLPALEGRRVGMLFQDTPHTEENQQCEFGAALSHAAPELVLIDGSGGKAPALEAICAKHQGAYHRVPLHSREHIYPGEPIAFAVFEQTRSGR
jgi:hypothetical protein